MRFRDRVLDLGGAARVMGIVNVTPRLVLRAGRLGRRRARVGALDRRRDGAALIDLGGQSYAAGNGSVAADEERRRVVPAVGRSARRALDVALSVDTYTASVADAALAAGAHLINDAAGCPIRRSRRRSPSTTPGWS